MQPYQRSRTPTIFSIYMLDVICCSLGCVILLWQANHQKLQESEESNLASSQEIVNLKLDQEAQRALIQTLNLDLDDARKKGISLSTDLESARKQGQTLAFDLLEARKKEKDLHSDLDGMRQKSKDLTSQLDGAMKRERSLTADIEKIRLERDDTKKLVLLRQKDYESARDALLLTKDLLKNAQADLDTLRSKNKETVGELANKVKANAEYLVKLAQAEDRIKALAKDVKERDTDLGGATLKLKDTQARLLLTNTQNQALEKLLAELQKANKDTTEKVTSSDLKIKTLEKDLITAQKELQEKTLLVLAQVKDLKEAKSIVVTLESERDRLSASNKAIQAAAEQRFAGIALTGRKVVFLVDMSGSMMLKDHNTEAPDKWPEVCDTIGKIMKSMPQLEHFQVLLFSDRVRYLFEKQDRRWLIYDGANSIKLTVDHLKAAKPRGETNLHAAFEEAFLYASAGMDSIYLFSDGLPNAGPALPPNANMLSESQLGEILSKDLRTKIRTEWNRKKEGSPPVRINAVGFFFESPEVGAFLWALSRENDGNFVGMSRP